METSLRMGTESINDLAESKLVHNINANNMQAIRYWLDNHKTNYIRPRTRQMVEQILGLVQKGDIQIEETLNIIQQMTKIKEN